MSLRPRAGSRLMHDRRGARASSVGAAGACRRLGRDLAAVDRHHRGPAVPGGEPLHLPGGHQLHGRTHRRLHLRQLRRGLGALALRRGAVQLAEARRGFRRAGRAVRDPARLGGVAHQHAGARLRAHAGAGDLHHAALHRRGRLDPARRSQCRLAQPDLHVRHRRRGGAVQHLQLHRPGRRHRALFVSLHLHLHLGRARTGVVGNGGRRQHPGGGDAGGPCGGSPCRWPCRRSWAG